MRLPASRRAGFTLIELLMVVAIVGTLALVGPRILINVNNFFLTTTTRNDVQRDARAALDIINRMMRQARYNTIVIETPSGQGPYSRIMFTHIDGRNMTIEQSGSELRMAINGQATVLSKNLVYIAFTFPRTDDPTIVSVSMTMGKNIHLGQRKVLELTIQKIRVMNI